jgi:16S rRNA processing protein RimM
MINKEDCLLLGTIAKPHGTKGSVLLRLRIIKSYEIRKWDSVFVEIDGLLVPFFIEEFKISSADALILKLESVDSETKAREMAGNAVYAAKEQVRLRKKTPGEFPDLKGYKVQDVALGFVGTAVDIADIANNPLLRVTRDGKEFLIPAHEDIILEVNTKKKEILIRAPEGLFEI